MSISRLSELRSASVAQLWRKRQAPTGASTDSGYGILRLAAASAAL